MSEYFFNLLPMSIEDLRLKPTISDAENICWLSAKNGIFNYWSICGIRIDIFAQVTLSSSNIGLPMDLYEQFYCDTISDNCVCSMPSENRNIRGNRPFLVANCDFAKFIISGPYFKHNYTSETLFEDMEIGYKIDFEFNWHAINVSTKKPDDDKKIISWFDITMVNMPLFAYCPEYEGYIIHPNEIPHLEISVEYLRQY